MKKLRYGMPELFKEGSKHFSGTEEAIMRNIEGCQQLATVTRTSFGPHGMNKMIVSTLDKITVTSDASAIIREMEVQHPAAKLIVLASEMQQQEVGDGSNFVVILAGELLNQAATLLTQGLHPSDIVAGYSLAEKECRKALESCIMREYKDIDFTSEKVLSEMCYSAICSKQHGQEELLAGLVAKACKHVMPAHPANFVVDNVRVVKIMGGNTNESTVVNGMVMDRPPEGLVRKVDNAKIAIFQVPIDSSNTDTKGIVHLDSAEELLAFNKGEEANLEKLISQWASEGVNVAVSGSSIGEMALHKLNKYGIMAVKVLSKFELGRVCRCTGGKCGIKMMPVHQEVLGHCSRVYVDEISSKKVMVFQQDKDDSKVATIVLRASTFNILNDLERACEDGINVIRAATQDRRFVPGAGATELELARKVAAYGAKLEGMEQYAVKKFAEALEVFPRTLAETAGSKASEIVTALYAEHEKGLTKTGIDTETGEVKDMTTQGIVDLYMAKQNALRLGAEAAISILRVDQIIMAKPAGGPKMPSQQPHNMDEEDYDQAA